MDGNPIDFRALFENAPGMFLAFLPDSPVFTIAAASKAWLETAGVPLESPVGRSLADVSSDPGLRASLQRVLTSKTPERSEFPAFVNSPIIGSDGNVRYLMHSVQDVTAEQELRRFRQLAENSVIGLMIGSPDGEISYANAALLELLGYTRDELNAGLVRWDLLTPPEFAAMDAECRRQVATTGKCAPYEKVWIAKDGRRIPVLLGASALEPKDGTRQIAGFVLDITERSRSRRDGFLLKLEDATRGLADPEEILRTASSLLCEQLHADRCAHRRFEPDQEHYDTLWQTPSPDAASLQGRHSLAEFGKEAGICLRAGLPFVSDNIETDPRTAAYAGAFIRAGVKAIAAAPLLKDGKLVGTVAVHQFRQRTWQPEEVELIELVANRCWESRARAEAVRALRTSEQRLRLAQSAGRIGTFESFLLENRMVWSPELEALFEIPEDSFEGTLGHWRKRVVPEDDARIMSEIHGYLAQRVPEFAYEFRGVMPGGELRWMGGRTRAYYDNDGKPVRLLGVVIDVHSQKQAEEHLRESEQRLRAIFDGTHEHIGLLSPDGIILEANRALLADAGDTPDRIVGSPYWEKALFRSRPGLSETMRQAVERAAAGESVRMEVGAFRADGEYQDFDISLHPVRNDRGEVVLIVPEGRNITEQKQDKERLRRQWQTFDTVLSNTPDLLYTYDLEGRFTYANRSLVSVSQRPLEGTIGKTVFEVGYPPELAEKIFREIQQVARTGQPLRGQTAFTLPTGEIRHYEYIYVPVAGSDGRVEAIAGSTRDVTDRRRAEEQERTREAQMRESARLESLGIMAGGIAHDFNNILVGVLGNASFLEESVNSRERQFVREIVLAAERAAELTRQMLAYSGKGRFVTEVLDLKDLIAENLTLLRASLSRNVTVDFELGAEPCFIRGDRAQIHQIVLNLLINASEAIGDRPGNVSVRVTPIDRPAGGFSAWLHAPVPAGRYAEIQVRDTGCGMAPEIQARIFDPFFTTKFTGRGLGLAATLGIVKGHKGDIQLESAPGSGTTFRVLLPSCERPASVRATVKTVDLKSSAGQTILVVDDEEVVRKMAMAALESRGFRVVVAVNGAEALNIIGGRNDISLVILDLTMPVMNGEEALPLIYAVRPRLPVVLSTGFGEAEIARRFPSSPIAGVLQKPYSIGALMARVTGALQQNQELTVSSDPAVH